jgi:hypothetical protein
VAGDAAIRNEPCGSRYSEANYLAGGAMDGARERFLNLVEGLADLVVGHAIGGT